MKDNKSLINQERSIITIDPERFPEIISEKLSIIDEIEDKIDELQKLTSEANRKADSFDSPENRSLWRKTKDVFTHGKTRRQLSETQDVVRYSTKALELQPKVNELLLEHQKQLAGICEYLFGISCYSIASIEAMIASLNKKLSGEGPDYSYLSDNVKEQFENVVKRLREQKDILLRQEQTEKKIVNQQDKFEKLTIRQQESEIHFQSLLDNLESSLLENIELDEQQAQKIEELFKRLKEKDLLDTKQSNQIDWLQQEVSNTNDAINELSKKLKKRIFASFLISIISIIALIILLVLHFTP